VEPSAAALAGVVSIGADQLVSPFLPDVFAETPKPCSRRRNRLAFLPLSAVVASGLSHLVIFSLMPKFKSLSFYSSHARGMKRDITRDDSEQNIDSN
jgi:hypothetical protein